MFILPASKVSVPFTVVMRTAVSTAPRAIELALKQPDPATSNIVADATQVFPVIFAIVIVPVTVLAPAPAPDAITGIPVVTTVFVVFAYQPPPTYPDVV